MDTGKILKFAVLGFGALGLVAFFMPLLHLKKANKKVSAWEVVKGVEKAKGEIDKLKKATENKIAESSDTMKEAHDKLDKAGKAADAAKYAFYIPFFPPAVFTLIGIIAIIGRFGRGSAVGALLMGVIGIGIWLFIRSIAKDVGVEDALGSAIWMLAISYFGATACGIAGLIKPEKEEFR